MGRDEQVSRLRDCPFPQRARELKCDQGAHAVAEEREGTIEPRTDGMVEPVHEDRKLRARGLEQSALAPWQLDETHLDRGWHQCRPGVEDRGTGASIWKAEEPEARVRPQIRGNDPCRRAGPGARAERRELLRPRPEHAERSDAAVGTGHDVNRRRAYAASIHSPRPRECRSGASTTSLISDDPRVAMLVRASIAAF